MQRGEQWQRVEQILDRVLDAPADQRAEVLDQACGDDTAIRAEVEALLAADSDTEAQAFLDTLDDYAELVDEVRPSSPATSGTLPSDPARFIPGSLLAERYRVVALVGRGGMGEVYRADDLKLGQPVALKFIPFDSAKEPTLLQRFHNEARVARSISHPNISRVYDIGEHKGQHFLTMEYIDGENLTSLLRRIGRLPTDKALQIARQLCAGLAAIHEQELLHRDLKPANVMIDSRGTTRITDFGLAGMAAQITGREIRAGTPAYMAPEQLAGRQVSVQSDLYSLGIVLHELFTGERPDPQLTKSGDSASSSRSSESIGTSTHLPPGVDSIVLRCLEQDPDRRPRSALEVASALPGRDPIAAVLAEGRTPDPKLLAVAGESGDLRASVGVGLLLFFLLGLAAVANFPQQMPVRQLPSLPKPPAVLEETARQIARDLGVPTPRDSATSFGHNERFLAMILAERRFDLRSAWELEQPSVAVFRYRESPSLLMNLVLDNSPRDFNRYHDSSDRPPGFAAVDLWPNGTLKRFQVESSPQLRTAEVQAAHTQATEGRTQESGDSPSLSQPTDWSALIRASGLDASTLQPIPSVLKPPTYADELASWSLPRGWTTPALWNEPSTDRAQADYSVHAAALGGQPVYFEVVPAALTEESRSAIDRRNASNPLFRFLRFSLLIAAILFAHYNVKHGRSDRQGAFRLAALGMLAMLVVWVLSSKHSPTTEYLNFFIGFGMATVNFVLIWVSYLAVEPYLRRLWPRMMVSWVRLIDGQFRDPLVGRDVLIGSVFGLTLWLVEAQFSVLAESLWNRPPITRFPQLSSLEAMISLGYGAAEWVLSAVTGVRGGLQWLVLLLVLNHFFHKRWLAIAIFLPITVLMNSSLGQPLSMVSTLVLAGLMTFGLFCFGLLALLYAFGVKSILTKFSLTLDPSLWWFDRSLAIVLSLAIPAAFAFWVSLGSRHVLGDPVGER